MRVQRSQRVLCPSFLDFSHTWPESGFAHTCFVPAYTARQLQLSYCCAIMDSRIICEHRHILSSSDSIETFKPGCGQFLSWGSGRQGDEVVKRKYWHHMEIKFPSFEIWHSNSHLLKLGIQRFFSDLDLSLIVILELWFQGRAEAIEPVWGLLLKKEVLVPIRALPSGVRSCCLLCAAHCACLAAWGVHLGS